MWFCVTSLIICQIRHELSVTINEISTSWKQSIKWRTLYKHTHTRICRHWFQEQKKKNKKIVYMWFCVASLIIYQIRHELSVTIHEISTSWKKNTLDGGPYT